MVRQVTADKQCRQSSSTGGSRRWIGVVLLAVVAVRAVNVTQPLVGNFATKQAVYAMAARNWALDRAPLWQPTIDCLAADGRRAWHLMEWPATAYLTAWLWKVGGGSLDVWGRFVGIACSAAAVLLAYLFTRRRFGEQAARAASLVIGFAPLMVAYGRGFLLEPSLVALSFAVVYGLDLWLDARRLGWLLVAAASLSVAVATKIYMMSLFVPLFGLLWSRREERRSVAAAWFAFAAAIIPAAAWYAWVASVSTTTGPAVDFHPFTRAEVHAWPHPLLTSPEFYRRIAGDLATVALTPVGLLLMFVGVGDRRFRAQLPWLGVSFGLIVLLPLKFYAANYYYLILLPPAAMAIGVGWERFATRFQVGPRTTAALVVLCLIVSARFAIGPGYRIPAEDRSVTTAAAALRQIAAPGEPIATLHGSTIDLLYYCDRPGWALNVADARLVEQIDALRDAGARRLVIVDTAASELNLAFTAWRKSQPIEAAGDGWMIVDLDGAQVPSSPSASSPPATAAPDESTRAAESLASRARRSAAP